MLHSNYKDLKMDSNSCLDNQEPSHPEPAIEQVTSDSRHDSSTEKMPHNSLAETEESNTRENLMNHKETILTCLNPSQLPSLLMEFNLAEICTNLNLQRRQKAEMLYEEIVKRGAFSAFLKELKKDEEHLGHKYIASLLTNQRFANEEEVKESQQLSDRITSQRLSKYVKSISIPALTPLLIEEKLLATDELENMMNPHMTLQDKTQLFFTLLRTKGPTAHYIFVHKCLAREESHISHKELYLQLTEPQTEEDAPPPRKIMKTSSLLEYPEALKTKKYREVITKMRECHLHGGEHWKEAEEIYDKVMSSPDAPLEMKIAILLESCMLYIVDVQPDVVIGRVDKAREMCITLYNQQCDALVLEGRCEWVLAELYRCRNEYDKAKTHINSAFHCIFNYETGEDRALINYTHSSILLDEESTVDITKAINALVMSISNASQMGLGFLIQQCKIRLAQAYLKTNTAKAMQVLSELNSEELPPRTQCMLAYTWSDVYRTKEDIEQAKVYAQLALDIAQRYDFEVEKKSAEKRRKKFDCTTHSDTSSYSNKDICIICERDIEDCVKEQELVFCAGECDGWMHRICAGLSRKAFQSAKSSSSPFLCHYCQNEKQNREIQHLQATISELEEKISRSPYQNLIARGRPAILNSRFPYIRVLLTKNTEATIATTST